jgi:hypothetical protein
MLNVKVFFNVMAYTVVAISNGIRGRNPLDIPAIATESFFFIDVIISLRITTCFGPYGPSSGEYNVLFIFKTFSRKLSPSQNVGG